MLKSLFNKVAGLRPVTLLKESPTQVFSCEHCKMFKNSYFEEHIRTAASNLIRPLNGCETILGNQEPFSFHPQSSFCSKIFKFLSWLFSHVEPCWPLGFTSYKVFLENKKRSGTSLSASFSAWFFKKNNSHVMFY